MKRPESINEQAYKKDVEEGNLPGKPWKFLVYCQGQPIYRIQDRKELFDTMINFDINDYMIVDQRGSALELIGITRDPKYDEFYANIPTTHLVFPSEIESVNPLETILELLLLFGEEK